MNLPGSSLSNSDSAASNGADFFASVTLESRTRTNPWAIGTSTAVNGALITLLLIVGLRTTSTAFTDPAHHPSVDIGEFRFLAPVTPHSSDGGSGVGSHDLLDPIRGNPPRDEVMPLATPIVPIINNPQLAVEPAIVRQTVTLPSDPSLPNIGIVNSPNVALASDGQGGPAGIGSGRNGTYGTGTGHTSGPGPGDSYIPGNGVSAPTLIYAPLAEFSDEARRNKYQGICMIAVVVDAQGIPRNPVVARTLGEGLDEKALEAVRRYKFKPGMREGHAVPTRITIEVNFRLF
jgi:periplasmic protein TonB